MVHTLRGIVRSGTTVVLISLSKLILALRDHAGIKFCRGKRKKKKKKERKKGKNERDGKGEKKTTRRVHGITYGTNPRGGAKGKRKEKKERKKERKNHGAAKKMSNGSRRNIGIARGIRIFLFSTIQRSIALIRSLYTVDRYYPSMFYLYFTNPPILSSIPRQREC